MDDRKNPEIQCYCMNLRHASSVLTKYYDQALTPLQITANQFFLLHMIHFLKKCNKSEIARCTRLERTTIIRNLDLLLKKDLIEEIPGPTKRNQLIQLTASGEETWARGHTVWQQMQKRTETLLGKEYLNTLHQLFDRIKVLEQQMEG